MWISFLKAAKPYLIPLNGNLALKFCIPTLSGHGLHEHGIGARSAGACAAWRSTSCEELCCGLQKRDPHGPIPNLSGLMIFSKR